MNPNNYSRLSRRQDNLTKRQIYLALGGVGLLLVLFVWLGIPLLFNFASRISSARNSQGSVTQDLGIAPNVPVLSQDYTATSSAQIKVSGVADPKVTVELFQDGNSQGTTVVGDDGKFAFDVVLNKGDNNFVAQAVSTKGKHSDSSDVYKINYSTSPPKLDLSNINDGQSFIDTPIAVTGKTDPNSSISVNGHMIIVDNSGNFNASLTLNSGDNKIKIIATDQAGNQTTKELTVKLNSP